MNQVIDWSSARGTSDFSERLVEVMNLNEIFSKKIKSSPKKNTEKSCCRYLCNSTFRLDLDQHTRAYRDHEPNRMDRYLLLPSIPHQKLEEFNETIRMWCHLVTKTDDNIISIAK
jgi:hypothetical protein